MATGNIRRNVPDYTGAGGDFRTDLDVLEQAVYDSRVRDRARQERLTRDRLRAQQKRAQAQSVVALAAQRDAEARERIKQLKATVKAQDMASGLLTDADFEAQWPARKAKIVQDEIELRARAQAALGEYRNII